MPNFFAQAPTPEAHVEPPKETTSELVTKLDDLVKVLETSPTLATGAQAQDVLNEFAQDLKACQTLDEQKMILNDQAAMAIELITGFGTWVQDIVDREAKLRSAEDTQAQQDVGNVMLKTVVDMVSAPQTPETEFVRKVTALTSQVAAIQTQISDFEADLNSRAQQLLSDIAVFNAKLQQETK